MPYYQGKIKCIYIDPPYNTGNEGWVYNDKVNSPKIKKWLGKVVGGESEDLCRHDKWLCMMYPRLKLLRDLLSDNGIIFISIDDNEQSNLNLVIAEIFGEENIIAQIVWKKKSGGGNAARFFADDHEYILCCAKNKDMLKPFFVSLNEKDKEKYKMKDDFFEERGPFVIKNLTQEGSLDERPNLRYEIKDPDGNPIKKEDGRFPQWRVEKKQFEKLLKEERIYFSKVKKKDGRTYYTVNTKQYLYEAVDDEGNPIFRKKKPRTIIDFVITGDSKQEMSELFGVRNHQDLPFTYAKPKDLIVHLIDIATQNDSIVLDSFAGSGTTAHAIIDLNASDSGNRKFILIELEDKVVKEVTLKKVKGAIKNVNNERGFEYCELDKPLFNEEGKIEEECSFEQLASYVYFTETNTNIDKKAIEREFIGKYNETDYYLIFKEKGNNFLNKSFLKGIKKECKNIIYADKCLIDNKTLSKYNVQFKQIPYEVKIY